MVIRVIVVATEKFVVFIHLLLLLATEINKPLFSEYVVYLFSISYKDFLKSFPPYKSNCYKRYHGLE